MLCQNLHSLRKLKGLSQEQVAEALGISRQAVAAYENGQTVPDIERCIQLSKLYGVSLDSLAGLDVSPEVPMPRKGKHIFGVVTIGEKGQIVIPKKARNIFGLKAGDSLLVLGDESQGLALLKTQDMLTLFGAMMNSMKESETEEDEEA